MGTQLVEGRAQGEFNCAETSREVTVAQVCERNGMEEMGE